MVKSEDRALVNAKNHVARLKARLKDAAPSDREDVATKLANAESELHYAENPDHRPVRKPTPIPGLRLYA